MNRLAVLTASIFALWGTNAWSADTAQLRCPIDRLDSAQAGAVGEAAIRRSAPGPWRDNLVRAIVECELRFRWTEAQDRLVYVHSLSVLSEPTMRARLGGRRVDFEVLRRIVEGDTVFQDAFSTTSDETAPLNAFLDRHRVEIERAAGDALADADARHMLSDYLASLAAGAWARRQFAAS